MAALHSHIIMRRFLPSLTNRILCAACDCDRRLPSTVLYFGRKQAYACWQCMQAVENMRLGMAPSAAAEDAMQRILDVVPKFQGALVAMNASGGHGGAAVGWVFHYAVADAATAGAPEVLEVLPMASRSTAAAARRLDRAGSREGGDGGVARGRLIGPVLESMRGGVKAESTTGDESGF